ncbi:MAG: glycosyltransferase family 39 protein [Methanobacterium sp.]|uniref:glycosyltransferase family 39 protein n=1 Tax=Methanobacterium sp. TaxID=2164 RepID=UPI003D645C5F|nr:glycosyltransferase family 39 protein [Methanobacterium sp.]
MSYNGLIRKLLDLDWTKMPNMLILVLLFFISRTPFLNLGFGTDPDAWRIAISAFNLNYFHIYQTSRFPGYPVPEFFNSLVINHGWFATNSLTMLLALISVIGFAMILKELNIKNKGLLVITYAFLPVIWINSTNTMDYMWAAAFIMFVWYFIIKKQYVLAGLMMGLAIGSRITSIILIFPFIYLILNDNNEKIRKITYFLMSMSIMALILFLPLLIQYGLGFLSYYPTSVGTSKISEDLNQLGLIALLWGILIFLISTGNLVDKVRKNDKFFIFLLFVVFLVSIMYIGAPYDAGYLIPAIPFGLVLLSSISKRKLFTIFCALLLLNSFISFELSNGTAPTIKEGLVLKDAEIRDKLTNVMERMVESNISDTIIISAEYIPILLYLDEKSQENPEFIEMNNDKMYWNLKKNRSYIYLLSSDKIKYWQKKGYKIYYMGSSAMEITRLNYNYSLTDYNCSNIFAFY